MGHCVNRTPHIHTRASTEFAISISSMANYDFNGCVRHSLMQRTWAFSGVLEMLNVMRHQIERYGALQATCRERNWNVRGTPSLQNKGDGNMSDNINQDEVPGGAPSFLVRVHYCQGATWQGTIQWLDTGRTASFRSTLELIHLMEQAVSKQLPPERREQEADWDAM